MLFPFKCCMHLAFFFSCESPLFSLTMAQPRKNKINFNLPSICIISNISHFLNCESFQRNNYYWKAIVLDKEKAHIKKGFALKSLLTKYIKGLGIGMGHVSKCQSSTLCIVLVVKLKLHNS